MSTALYVFESNKNLLHKGTGPALDDITMKNYVITIKDSQRSMMAAQDCIASGAKFGITIEHFWAITPMLDTSQLVIEKRIPLDGFNEVYSRKDRAVCAFLSHYSLWEMCSKLKEEVTIFEHDAIVVDFIPEFINYKGCINLGAPSYGKAKIPTTLGVNKLTSKRYFPGAHAYRIKPGAAELLINESIFSAAPTDIYLHIDRFPFLEELYPWPVVARDSFTTIQNEAGCKAKHRYDREYDII